MDDGGLGQGVCSDQLVVGRMVGDNDNTDLAGDTLRSPCKVTGLETEGAVFAVTTTGTDEMDPLCSDTGVGFLSAGFESALLPCNSSQFEFRLEHMSEETYGLSTTHGNMHA